MRVFDRNVYEVDIQALELDDCQRIIASSPIEGLILKCTEERSFDIGALCYQNRDKVTRALIKSVDHDSLRPERMEAVRAWVVHKITLFYTSKSAYTIYQNATELNGFFNWADKSEFEDFLTSPESYHQALQAYTQYLNQETGRKKVIFTANRLQSEALRSGPVFFPNTTVNFRDDLPMISNKSGAQKPTEPPLEKEIEAYLTTCQYLFDGLTDFLLNFKKFPAQIPFMTEYLWLLPGEYPYVSEQVLAETSKVRLNIKWDYVTGRVRTLDEATKLSSRPEYQVRYDLEDAHAVLQKANSDRRHEKRMRLAKLAHDAFIPLFAANSGLNEQSLRDLTFNSSYETFDSEEQGFVGIKLRACGREVNFTIKKTFMKQFDKYIRLRKFICHEIEHEFLFVGMTIYGQSVGGQVRPAEIQKHNSRIESHLITNFEGLSYQTLRKYKCNFLLSKGHSVQVVSALMQTSETTILKSYAQANETTAIAEITAMIKRLVGLLDDYRGEEIPAGDCAGSNGRAEAIPPPPDYEPNCKNFEGCIFCSQFRTHANEPSIRKLLSMRFVTLEYLNSCADKNHFDKVHGAAVAQIDRIIAELLEERPDMASVVDRIKAEISNNFELSDYWKRFYHRMVQLRVMK
ncbi:integrase [Pseudomonas sp. S12(2018)]|uniref:hypothetical protein n=1 Tax=Pseudomonas sp. S12(2018) TaxID=2219664 RepID=UPI0020CDA1F8|nr:hypothetical protein [Pseudomonas sp. S12(2018)]MCQ0170165.1 integrase [Pseudomonas sp. S12(2018)]